MSRDERGTVLILGAGLVAVVLLAVVVLVDASAAFVQRQQLVGLADAVALTGAQAVDLDAYYRDGASDRTQLDPAAVAVRVQRHLMTARASGAIPGVRLEALGAASRSVTLELSAPVRLPFGLGLPEQRIRVRSEAVLAYRPVGSEPAPYP